MKTVEIETNGKKIIVVEVPEDAYYPRCISYPLENISILLYFTTGARIGFERIELQCKLLGTITDKEIDFDCSELAEKEWDGTHYWYKNYLNESEMFKGNPNESAYSLLQSKGISFANPLGDEPQLDDYERYEMPMEIDPCEDAKACTARENKINNDWQTAESQIWKKAVILLVVE